METRILSGLEENFHQEKDSDESKIIKRLSVNYSMRNENLTVAREKDLGVFGHDNLQPKKHF